jgi:Tol biopolymer transport system component
VKNTLACGTIALLVLALTIDRSFAQTAEELYQKGIQLEEVKGELEKAIEMYNDVVKQSSTNKPLAAKALLHLGRCYEKLGKKEATKAYERIIKEFADQQEVVKEARARLSALISASAKPSLTVRQVWAGPGVDVGGGISPDGRYLTFVDWETGDLAVRDLATGEKRRLTNKGSWNDSEEFALSSIVSPDGKQIAYAWFNKDEFYDLRVIGSDGSNPRVIYPSEELEFIRPADWSADGKRILAALFRKDKPLQFGLVSVADGSVRILKTLEARDPYLSSGPLFSPDGRYVAYSFPPRDDAAEQDISLLTIDGRHEVALVQHPANDYLLGWSPDGKKVLFASDRAGTIDAWVIDVAEGKPQGVPQLVRRDMGSISPMGLTQKGCLYYATPGLVYDIFTITLDPATGKIITPPNKDALPYEGYNMSPDWSHDGKYLAYISRRGHMNRRSIICIYSPETGKVRELLARLNLGNPRWTPDGRSILVQADVTSGQGIYRMDATTGEVVPFIPIRKEGKESRGSAQLSADGKLIFYVREDGKTKLCQILVRNLETGEEKELDRAPFDNHSIALSPDGRRLALLIRAEKQLRVLKVMPSNGGKQTELRRFEQSGRWIIDIAWTPDGRYIFFSKGRPDGKWELWRIPSEGGEPQNLGLAMNRFQHLSVHPDGRRITFASRPTEAELPEVWVMENFLPKEDKAQK